MRNNGLEMYSGDACFDSEQKCKLSWQVCRNFSSVSPEKWRNGTLIKLQPFFPKFFSIYYSPVVLPLNDLQAIFLK
jgi:hypothetical protein